MCEPSLVLLSKAPRCVKAGRYMCVQTRDWLFLDDSINQIEVFLHLCWSHTPHERAVDELSPAKRFCDSGVCLLAPDARAIHACVKVCTSYVACKSDGICVSGHVLVLISCTLVRAWWFVYKGKWR